MGRLVLRKTMAVAATVCLVLSTLFCVTGCSDNDDENVTEFRATDLAEYTGDSFTERFLLNSDKGTYERYIGGIYKGETYAGPTFGTLYETGSYTEGYSITFRPEKRYNLSTGKLENLGTYERWSYSGTITSDSLIVNNHTYKRQ